MTVGDRSGPDVAELDFTSLQWGRVMDGVSEAQVNVPAHCCGKLADVWPWRHELRISRNGEQQWVGPIEVVANCRSGITLVAKDMLGWLEHRVIHEDHCWDPTCGGAPISAVAAASLLVQDGFGPDDPDVLKYLKTYGAGVIGGRQYAANSKYVIDALKDLGQGSLDFTTIGRSILLMRAGYELGRLPLLNCEHFAGDVCTTVDGQGAATKAIVTGDSQLGIVGTSGGVDPYFGLLEVLVNDDTIKSGQTAIDQAAGLVNGHNPPPVLVQPPQGSTLNPSTPVCLEQLVPGVTAQVAMDCTCRTSNQLMRLT
ncbi:MAG: hypothetical protein LC721_00445, partial [Actinobacteria bacterium]|nr:hypothetical protein [Actinomycetota bacterium]